MARIEHSSERRSAPQVDLEGTILGEGVTLGTDMYHTKLNNNVIVFGTPGGGKTQSLVKPNIMQLNSNLVVTDPKGTLLGEVRPLLEQAGYEVRFLDFIHPDVSCTYNPFAYVRNTEDICFIAHAVVYADSRYSTDPFWDNASEMLFKALSGCAFARQKGTPTFSDILSIVDQRNYAPYGCWDASNRLEEIFEELRRDRYFSNPGELPKQKFLLGKSEYRDFALQTWDRFKNISNVETTNECIYISLLSTLDKLCSNGKEHLFSNEAPIDLRGIGKRKTALFLVVSDMDRSMDFMLSIFYTQLFKELCDVADTECRSRSGRLEVPVRVILDDFANQNRIKDFDKVIAAVRSRDIWLMPICQSVSQLHSLYGDAAQTIMACCDTQIFIGVNDMDTARDLSVRMNIPIESVQSTPLGREYLFVRGQQGKVVERYDTSTHPNAPWLGTADGDDRRFRLRIMRELSKRRDRYARPSLAPTKEPAQESLAFFGGGAS